MRKLLMVLGLVCLAVAVAAPAALPKTPKQDSAFGSGVRSPSCSTTCPTGAFSFNATSGPSGENASGWFTIDFVDYASFTGSVTCLHVSGHTATLVGQINRGTGAADPSTAAAPMYYVAVVNDNGRAKPHLPSPDQMSFVAWDTADGWAANPGYSLAQVCADGLGALGDSTMFGLVSGDVTVIDK
jgi:hypothetical protein